MATTTQELLGVNKALDHLEGRVKAYRKMLLEMSRGHHPAGDIEEVAVTTGEVTTIEALIRGIAVRVTGAVPDEAEWGPMHPYCSRNEQRKDGFAVQNYEYFRWALLWIGSTRTYLVYLGGLSAEGEPRGSETESAESQQEHDVSESDAAISLAGKVRTDAVEVAEGRGRYVGRIVLTPLPDGRLMEVIEGFGFVDPVGLEWSVPSGTRVDGASIPQPLWSIVGSPFTGRYRDASVVHDYYCDVRIRPWKAVHRVFYDAMIASAVGTARAKLMYAAVYFGGPRWSETVIHNTKLEKPPLSEDRQLSVKHSPFTLDIMRVVEVGGTSVDDFLRSDEWIPPRGPESRLHLNELEKLISEYDPSPEQIAAALDTSTGVMDAVIPKQRTIVDVQNLRF